MENLKSLQVKKSPIANETYLLTEDHRTAAIVYGDTPEQRRYARLFMNGVALSEQFANVISMMEQDHIQEIANDHFGDASCSYCDAIEAGNELLARIHEDDKGEND